MFNFFNIQYYLIAEWLVPIRLRTAVIMAFIKACFAPIISLHNEFMAYRKAKLYEVEMNYQVPLLEAFLNNRFDGVERRIYIDDAQTVEQIYIFQEDELEPLWLHQESEDDPIYLHTEGETMGDLLNDFVVYVPVSVSLMENYSESELRAMIATKWAGKRYKIELY